MGGFIIVTHPHVLCIFSYIFLLFFFPFVTCSQFCITCHTLYVLINHENLEISKLEFFSTNEYTTNMTFLFRGQILQLFVSIFYLNLINYMINKNIIIFDNFESYSVSSVHHGYYFYRTFID
jgi:hypothetical protein